MEVCHRLLLPHPPHTEVFLNGNKYPTGVFSALLALLCCILLDYTLQIVDFKKIHYVKFLLYVC